MGKLISINRFGGGVVDSYGRGKEPEDSFSTSKNLVPTRTGSLETTHGFSTTGGFSTLPNAFPAPPAGTATLYAITKLLAHPFPFSAEEPTSYDGRLFYGRDNQISPVDHYFLDKWFDSTGSLGSANSGFVALDESKIFAATDTTISGTITHSLVTIKAQTVYGLSTVTDYYKNWRIFWDAGGSNAWATITAYSSTGDTATFTIFENIGSNGMTWSNTGNFTLQRWFFAPASMSPTFDIPPGRAFAANGRVRASGGASSTENKYPIIIQYINRTWLTGHSTASYTYRGTYADQMESPVMIGSGSAEDDIISSASLTTGGATLLTAADYQVLYSLEYDSFQESKIGPASSSVTADGTTHTAILFNIRIRTSRMSRRVTAVNIYVKQTISGVTSSAYFIKRIDLINDAFGSGFSNWTALDTDLGTPAQNGVWRLVGAAANEGSVSGAEWFNRGATYYERTGRFEQKIADREIVNWKYAELVNGKAFFGNFYDPNLSQIFSDQIRYTPTDDYDIVPVDRLNFETSVARGDPESIKGLTSDNGYLYVFKDGSIYGIFIGDNPAFWVLDTVSLQDGLYAINSLHRVPERGIIFADVDQIKLLRGGRILPLTANIELTYYTLSGKANVIVWYDKIDRSINFVTDANSLTFWRGYLDLAKPREDGRLGVPFYRCDLPTGSGIEFVAVERDESVIFSNSNVVSGSPAFPGLFKWHKTDYSYGGGAIIPYLLTNERIVDEMKNVVFNEAVVTKNVVGDSGTLDNRLLLDGTVVKTWQTQDKTKKSLFQKRPPDVQAQGRKIQFEYNKNSSGEYNSAGKIQLDAIEIFGETRDVPNR